MTKNFENAIKSARPDGSAHSSVIPSCYDMSADDTAELMELAYSKDPFRAIHLAFVFGFVMGNRATHSRKLKRL